MQGIVFYMEDESEQQLFDLLNGVIDSSWYWSVGPGESYYSKSDCRFLESNIIMDGQSFIKHISKGKQYLIFVDIKAFPTLEEVVEINNYEDFLGSSCILTLLVIDSNQVVAFSRDYQIISSIHSRANTLGHERIRLLNESEVVDQSFSIWGSSS